MKRINLFTFIAFWLFCSFHTLAMNEDYGVPDESTAIHIYPKSSPTEGLQNLIIPSAIENVDYLSVNKEQKQIILFRIDQGPIELERIFYPSLPWDIPQDQFEQFMSAHSFYLKQLNDGAYKVDLHASLLGGIIDNRLLKKEPILGSEAIFVGGSGGGRRVAPTTQAPTPQPAPVKTMRAPAPKITPAAAPKTTPKTPAAKTPQQTAPKSTPQQTAPKIPAVKTPQQSTPKPTPAAAPKSAPATASKTTPTTVKTPQSTAPKSTPTPKPRGMQNPKVREAARVGREKHKELKQQVGVKRQKNPGWEAEKMRFQASTGRRVKPDVTAPSGRWIELKPNTPSGRLQGARQARTYETVTGRPGRVVYYDPIPRPQYSTGIQQPDFRSFDRPVNVSFSNRGRSGW